MKYQFFKIFEGDSSMRGKLTYNLSFLYKNELIEFNSNSLKDISSEIFDWLYDNGYSFVGDIHKSNTRKLLSKKELDRLVSSTSYGYRSFHNIGGSDKYLMNSYNSNSLINFIVNMLLNFGIKEDNISYSGFNDLYKSGTEGNNDDLKKSIESPEKIKSFSKFFHTPDETEDDYILSDLEKNLNKSPKPQPYSKIDTPPTDNPFKQAICILGEPGAGKSVTTLNALKSDSNHFYKLLIPTDMTSSLLLQFVSGELRLNALSKMIIKAYENPDKLYTILIDEFHKPLTIRRVNDELLQAISTKRYSGQRFISSDIAYEYISEKLEDLNIDEDVYSYHGNIKLPDNFGFIFLSSKPSIVVDNEDLYDRLDIVYIKEGNRDHIKSIDDMSKIKISENKDKKEFKDIIKSSDKESLNDFINKFNS